MVTSGNCGGVGVNCNLGNEYKNRWSVGWGGVGWGYSIYLIFKRIKLNI